MRSFHARVGKPPSILRLLPSVLRAALLPASSAAILAAAIGACSGDDGDDPSTTTGAGGGGGGTTTNTGTGAGGSTGTGGTLPGGGGSGGGAGSGGAHQGGGGTGGSASCADIAAEYDALVDASALVCKPTDTCVVLDGHCGVGIGGCWYVVNAAAVSQAQLDALAQQWVAAGCQGPVCDCAPPPSSAACEQGVCTGKN